MSAIKSKNSANQKEEKKHHQKDPKLLTTRPPDHKQTEGAIETWCYFGHRGSGYLIPFRWRIGCHWHRHFSVS
jgi:hypothetical protein